MVLVCFLLICNTFMFETDRVGNQDHTLGGECLRLHFGQLQ